MSVEQLRAMYSGMNDMEDEEEEDEDEEDIDFGIEIDENEEEAAIGKAADLISCSFTCCSLLAIYAALAFRLLSTLLCFSSRFLRRASA